MGGKRTPFISIMVYLPKMTKALALFVLLWGKVEVRYPLSMGYTSFFLIHLYL
jgi:hypothetical protein